MNLGVHNKSSSAVAKRIHKTLASMRVGTLGVIDTNGRPHLSAIYFHTGDEFVLSFATKTNTKKHQLIKENGNVQLLAFDEAQQLTIQVTGIAHEVVDQSLINQIIDNTYWVAARTADEAPPIAKMHAGEFVAYQILPMRITLSHFLPSEDAEYATFESLDFA